MPRDRRPQPCPRAAVWPGLRAAHPQCRAAGVHGHVHAQQHLIQQLHHPFTGVVGVVQVGGSRRRGSPTARRFLQAAKFILEQMQRSTWQLAAPVVGPPGPAPLLRRHLKSPACTRWQ